MSFRRVLLLLFVISYSLLTCAGQETSQLTPAQIGDIEKAITAFMSQDTCAQHLSRDRQRWEACVDRSLRLLGFRKLCPRKNFDHVPTGIDL